MHPNLYAIYKSNRIDQEARAAKARLAQSI